MTIERIYNLATKLGGFAFDFECVDSKGRPTTNVLEARPVLLSLAFDKPAQAVCLEWGPEAETLLRNLLMTPEMTAVAHYGYYDFLVAHFRRIVDLRTMTARPVDTRLLCWLRNEEEDLDLKSLVFNYLGHKMTTFSGITSSPLAVKAARLQKEIENLPKVLNKKIKQFRTDLRADGLKPKEIKLLVEKGTPAALAKMEEKRTALEEEVRRLQVMAHQEFRQYAADDARQTWRLFFHTMAWIKGEGLLPWLEVELANLKQSLRMSAEGAHIDTGIAERLQKETKVVVDELEATVYNIAKQQFNLNSAIQMAKVLYDDLGIEPLPGTARLNYPQVKNEPWAYSAASEILMRLPHPIGQAILDFRAAHTIYSNFLVGLPKQAQEDLDGRSRAHVIFDSNGTVTGRWSSRAI